jgi:hypothetical protein
MFGPMSTAWRVLAMVAAALLMAPGLGFAVMGMQVSPLDIAGVVLLGVVSVVNRRATG